MFGIWVLFVGLSFVMWFGMMGGQGVCLSVGRSVGYSFVPSVELGVG